MKDLNKFIFLFIGGFILNFIWEILHYQLYYDFSGIAKYPHLILASFTDAVIIIFIFIIISLKNKNLKWINKPKKLDYFVVMLLGLLIAAFIEVRALNIERWAYTANMPTVFEIGLSPLLQLSTTAILSLIIINFLNKRRHQGNSIPQN